MPVVAALDSLVHVLARGSKCFGVVIRKAHARQHAQQLIVKSAAFVVCFCSRRLLCTPPRPSAASSPSFAGAANVVFVWRKHDRFHDVQRGFAGVDSVAFVVDAEEEDILVRRDHLHVCLVFCSD